MVYIIDTQLEEPVLELPPLKVGDLPIINTQNPAKLYELVTSLISETKASSGLIWNTFEDLEHLALDSLREVERESMYLSDFRERK